MNIIEISYYRFQHHDRGELQFAPTIRPDNSPRQFAPTICPDNLPRQFAPTICPDDDKK